ncbi:MAG: MBL fold metallo-hydrolase [Clostridia bacterium]|nr:MBL fold metallo-hydrolase [Clostridia bacterium]
MKNKSLKIICLTLAVLICGSFSACDISAFDGFHSDGFGGETGGNSNGNVDIVNEDLGIHFLQLGNSYTGDCTLIDIGDTEVLIDAGSRKNSATTISSYINSYCEDGVLEYVIATHADQDHIAGFVGNSGTPKRTGILYQYEVETLIQFPLTDKTTEIYGNYLDAVEYAKGNGTAVYTALECWKNENGAKRSYDLGGGVTMNVLYQRFYEEKTSDENDYSVCVLFSQGENHYLFTGDLEKKGEASLIANNELPKCKLFKAGHHGSPTSNTKELLAIIQPEIVCVSCCCGSSEYTSNVANMFPSQAFVDNVAPYTDKIYVTTVAASNSNGFKAMNGNITVSSKDGKTVQVRCSNNNTLFKHTEWFKNNRTMPNAWKD